MGELGVLALYLVQNIAVTLYAGVEGCGRIPWAVQLGPFGPGTLNPLTDCDPLG
jgi:hypothetical protein